MHWLDASKICVLGPKANELLNFDIDDLFGS